MGGSDTDFSDTEPPLTNHQQVVAILNLQARCPPPLPVESRYAQATARAVVQHTLRIPADRKTQAHALALSIPLVAFSIDNWLYNQRCALWSHNTLFSALCAALNPNSPSVRGCKASGTEELRLCGVRGLALNLRMHPFTRFDVQHARDKLVRDTSQRLHVPGTGTVYGCDTDADTLEAAVVLVVFQRAPRYFGAYRYRCLSKYTPLAQAHGAKPADQNGGGRRNEGGRKGHGGPH